MPTATIGGLAEFHNAGPLTSVWTTPTAVCSDVPVARSGIAMEFNDNILYQGANNCGKSEFITDCYPGGEKQLELFEGREGPQEILIAYHSPGLYCPDGWETAGVIDMNNGTPSATGLFRPSIFSANGEATSFPRGDFVANMLTSALAPTETAIVCCPSGFTADPYVGCYSNFPVTELAGETACRRTYTGADPQEDFPEMTTYTFAYFGTTTTGSFAAFSWPSDWREEDSFSTSTATLGSSGLPTGNDFEGNYQGNGSWKGVATAGPVYLVNSGEGDGKGGNDDDHKESAARALMPTSTWATVGAVMAAWGVSIAAGVGLLASW